MSEYKAFGDAVVAFKASIMDAIEPAIKPCVILLNNWMYPIRDELERRLAEKDKRISELESALEAMIGSCPLCRGGPYAGQMDWMCDYCGETGKTHANFVHADDCPWARAKALLDETENT